MKLPLRLVDWLPVSDPLLGDLLEQTSSHSPSWFAQQIICAIIAATCLTASVTVRELFIGISIVWRFDRVSLFALGGAASFWAVAFQFFLRSAQAFDALAATTILLGGVLYSIGSGARLHAESW